MRFRVWGIGVGVCKPVLGAGRAVLPEVRDHHVPPAERIKPPFQALHLHWRSPKSGCVWYKARQLTTTICSSPRIQCSAPAAQCFPNSATTTSHLCTPNFQRGECSLHEAAAEGRRGAGTRGVCRSKTSCSMLEDARAPLWCSGIKQLVYCLMLVCC